VRLDITRVDRSLPLPSYGTPGSAGFDFYAREEVTIPAGTLGYIPSNSIIGVPRGHVLMVALRSSTPGKKGLLSPHGVGIIDQDYCGPEDEIKIEVYNFTDGPCTVHRGERIAQGLLLPVVKCEWEEREASATSRGGFGSTD